MISCFELAKRLSLTFGIEIIGKVGDSNTYRLVIPDLPLPEGFEIQVSFKWRSLIADFIAGNYSAKLIRTMCFSSQEQRALFISFAKLAKESKFGVTFVCDGLEVDPVLLINWPHEKLKTIQFSIDCTPFDKEDNANADEKLWKLTQCILGMLLSLLPIEIIEEHGMDDVLGYKEGDSQLIRTQRYERDYRNRSACIAWHGCKCVICGFSFESFYGNIGIGFINVHHVIPVSKLGKDYLIDPVEDLIPVCPNCHAMLHKKDPPFTSSELKKILIIKNSIDD